MSDHTPHLDAKIDRLTELVVERFTAIDERLQGLEDRAAELRGLLRLVLTGLDRLNEGLPLNNEALIAEGGDGEEIDDGFLTPPAGRFLH